MLVPSFADTRIATEHGYLTPPWNAVLAILLEQMQQNLSNAGFVLPPQNTEVINSINPTSIIGTLIYNPDIDRPVVRLQGGMDFCPIQIVNRKAVSADYEALITDYIIAYTSTAGAYTATLPKPEDADKQIIIVKDESGNANVNNITVNVADGSDINGSPEATISQAYGVLTLYCNGTQWFTL